MSKRKKNQPICLVDLDGTLCDYQGGLRRDLGRTLSLPDVEKYLGTPDLHDLEKVPYIKAQIDLIRSVPGWWGGLRTLADGFAAMGVAHSLGYHIHVLTAGPRQHAAAWKEKVEWYQEYVLPAYPDSDITITRDKSLVHGEVLVDDWPSYVNGWLKSHSSGLALMPDRPYNRSYTHQRCFRFDPSKDTLLWEVLGEAKRGFDEQLED